MSALVFENFESETVLRQIGNQIGFCEASSGWEDATVEWEFFCLFQNGQCWEKESDACGSVS